MTPRVLFVNQTGVMSGAEYVLANVVPASPNASVFLLEGGPMIEVLERQGINVEVAPDGARLGAMRRDQSFLSAVPLTFRLLKLISAIVSRARKHDVVYANSQKAFLLSALASLFFRRPLIWHLHDILSDRHFGGTQRRVQIKLANARASAVIVPSRAAGDAFIEAGGHAELTRIVPNGIALDPPAVISRDALGLPQGPLVGVFSRLAAWKGQHVVIEALKALPGVQCVLVGSALFGEDAYRQRLEAMVEAEGLGDRVHFLGQRSDVPVLMQAVDAVVHSSVDPEPFGLTIVEAMLAGTPVIATDCGASAEILDEGRAGMLVPADDAEALAEALRLRFAKPDPFLERALIARARVREFYGLETMRAGVLKVVGAAA